MKLVLYYIHLLQIADTKRSRFSEEQIIGILRLAKAGMCLKDVCRPDLLDSVVI